METPLFLFSLLRLFDGIWPDNQQPIIDILTQTKFDIWQGITNIMTIFALYENDPNISLCHLMFVVVGKEKPGS